MGEQERAAGPDLTAVEEEIDELTEPVYEPYRRIRSWVRPGTTVLDVGCGNGKVGRYLIDAGAIVDGIEPSDLRVDFARSRLRYVSSELAGPSLSDPSIAASYDFITFLDVLEHLADPMPVLEWAVGRLSPGGSICALIPNSAHWSFRLKMLRGDWAYADSGFFDKTHLRFFDPDTMQLLRPAGTTCAEVSYASFDRLPGPWAVRRHPRLFATHGLLRWRRGEGAEE